MKKTYCTAEHAMTVSALNKERGGNQERGNLSEATKSNENTIKISLSRNNLILVLTVHIFGL